VLEDNCASVLREEPIEFVVELSLGAASRPGQPLALLLTLVAPSQALAELLSAVAFLCPPDQGAQGCALAL
jgi:hypothetical protein